MKTVVEKPERHLCPNCGAESFTAFCGQCGQSRIWPLSVGHWLNDVFREISSVDGRLWLTLRLLLLKPGRLDLDWEQGRREKHIGPIRIYLIITALFFLVSIVYPGQNNVIVEIASGFIEASDNLAETNEEAVTPEEVAEQVLSIVAMSMKWFMILGMVPTLAAITKVFLGRRGEYYSCHLVASLHAHSVLYFCMIIFLLLVNLTGYATDADTYEILSLVFVFPAFLISFTAQSRRIYGRGWLSTLFRVCTVVLTYVLVLVVVGVVMGAVAGSAA